MLRYYLVLIALTVGFLVNDLSAIPQKDSTQKMTVRPKSFEDSVLDKYLRHGAWRYPITSPEWGRYIDSALEILPHNAYFWQQRSMPYYKQMKYEVGRPYVDSAVKYDSASYIDYRGFLECIFSKRYHESIQDFQAAKRIIGNGAVMDHNYDFYIGLCYLQLARYDSAEQYLKLCCENETKLFGKEGIHYLHYLYLGITLFEQQRFEEAINNLDLALAKYPNFSDAQYYKYLALEKLGRKDEAKHFYQEAKSNFDKGYTINEDNVIYERYPYQIRQTWFRN